MYELITVLVTVFGLLNITNQRKNIDSKITYFATCRVVKNGLLDVRCASMIKYRYQTVKAGVLYERTDAPAGQPTDNPRILDWLRGVHRIIPELTVWVCYEPRLNSWHWCGSDPDPDAKSWSGIVRNTHCSLLGNVLTAYLVIEVKQVGSVCRSVLQSWLAIHPMKCILQYYSMQHDV